MTEKYDPYENTFAERRNRTLKYEQSIKRNIILIKRIVKCAVNIYNNFKPYLN